MIYALINSKYQTEIGEEANKHILECKRISETKVLRYQILHQHDLLLLNSSIEIKNLYQKYENINLISTSKTKQHRLSNLQKSKSKKKLYSSY